MRASEPLETQHGGTTRPGQCGWSPRLLCEQRKKKSKGGWAGCGSCLGRLLAFSKSPLFIFSRQCFVFILVPNGFCKNEQLVTKLILHYLTLLQKVLAITKFN